MPQCSGIGTLSILTEPEYGQGDKNGRTVVRASSSNKERGQHGLLWDYIHDYRTVEIYPVHGSWQFPWRTLRAVPWPLSHGPPYAHSGLIAAPLIPQHRQHAVIASQVYRPQIHRERAGAFSVPNLQPSLWQAATRLAVGTSALRLLARVA